MNRGSLLPSRPQGRAQSWLLMETANKWEKLPSPSGRQTIKLCNQTCQSSERIWGPKPPMTSKIHIPHRAYGSAPALIQTSSHFRCATRDLLSQFLSAVGSKLIPLPKMPAKCWRLDMTAQWEVEDKSAKREIGDETTANFPSEPELLPTGIHSPPRPDAFSGTV